MAGKFIVFAKILCMVSLLSAQTPQVEWTAFYNGPANSFDWGDAIAVDSSGNVYVTGNSYNGDNQDIVTIKYDSAGNEQWVARYNGPANKADEVNGIALDYSGNVIVTGGSKPENGLIDCITIKYSSGGNEIWVARYNGPGNRGDVAYDLYVDHSDNIYITGQSFADDSEITTIKYDSAGNEQWVSRFSGNGCFNAGRGIAVDPSGNVYVTGDVLNDGKYNCATVKYDANGTVCWSDIYVGPDSLQDWGWGIALAPTGNVYVCGYSRFIMSGDDFLLLKYDENGTRLWDATYNGIGYGSDSYTKIAVDEQENIYVTGRSWGGATYYNWATVKYDSNGNQLWVQLYDGTKHEDDWPAGIALDDSGNTYVVGVVTGRYTNRDCCTVKYSPDGNLVWDVVYESNLDAGSDIVLDHLRDVYVTGKSSDDIITIKYSQITGVEEKGQKTRASSPLLTCKPTPFVIQTTLSFKTVTTERITLGIFDVSGNKVKTLIDETMIPGCYRIIWDARNDCGKEVASGVYFCRLDMGNEREIKKLVVVK